VLAINRDWSHLLAQVEVPVTLFCGTEDGGAPIDNIREFAARYQHMRLLAFEGLGKLACFLRWPDLVAEIEAALPDA
jgi:pimeloyl-ACP methyl ester carboxylesterase